MTFPLLRVFLSALVVFELDHYHMSCGALGNSVVPQRQQVYRGRIASCFSCHLIPSPQVNVCRYGFGILQITTTKWLSVPAVNRFPFHEILSCITDYQQIAHRPTHSGQSENREFVNKCILSLAQRITDDICNVYTHCQLLSMLHQVSGLTFVLSQERTSKRL